MATTETPRGKDSKKQGAPEVSSAIEKGMMRFTLGLPSPAVSELEQLERMTGEGRGALLRYALVLLARYVRAVDRGEEIRIVNPRDPSVQRVIDLPINIKRQVKDQTNVTSTRDG